MAKHLQPGSGAAHGYRNTAAHALAAGFISGLFLALFITIALLPERLMHIHEDIAIGTVTASSETDNIFKLYPGSY